MNGLFITFEGPDGSGKTTQLQLLANYIKAQGYPCLVTREPGGTRISDKIREILLDPKNQELAPETEVYLYAASRAQHVQENILPALKKGTIVLCDRFVEASVAYQGYGLGFGEEVIRKMNDLAIGGLEPHRTYLIDVPSDEGRKRMSARIDQEFEVGLDRIEKRELEYHNRVRMGFQELAQRNKRMCKINGCQSIEGIHQDILADFTAILEASRKK